jgi:hypothetical protein
MEIDLWHIYQKAVLWGQQQGCLVSGSHQVRLHFPAGMLRSCICSPENHITDELHSRPPAQQWEMDIP